MKLIAKSKGLGLIFCRDDLSKECKKYGHKMDRLRYVRSDSEDVHYFIDKLTKEMKIIDFNRDQKIRRILSC